ncbi:hypothetical protein E0493_17780 [Roseomonas sp. M0104]|uniref:Uncharacterized protein n=1 Tax=Teichococcus coralli TaxID=2545983 RepID=A0A845BP72_9PROT|nr:hypothetical protein [Pseudoroseomonas coralli]MXP65199.1 hypothetical protein [Pseudoroseomonas coralli]
MSEAAGVAPPGPTGVPAAQMSRVMGTWLARAIGPVALLDLSFPALNLMGAFRDGLPGLSDVSAMPAAAGAFFRRFRIAGGRHPLFGLGSAEDAAILADDRSIWSAGGRQRLAYAEAPVHPGILRQLREAESWLLLRDPGAAMLAAPELSELDALRLRLCLGEHAAEHVLLLPAREAAGVRHGLAEAARQLGLLEGDPEDRPGALELRVQPPPPGVHLLAEVPAAALIHDGAYRSEADGGYTWVWTGPARHFRMALGGLPAGAGWIKVAVIGVGKASQLDRLVATLNGVPVPHRLERWSETSAAVIVDLPDPLPGSLLLGLAVPETMQEPEGSRRLGLCVHKIEIFA